MKTIKQHLSELPEPYQSEALANMLPESSDYMQYTAHGAINRAFPWNRTKQGHMYWAVLHNALSRTYTPQEVELLRIFKRNNNTIRYVTYRKQIRLFAKLNLCTLTASNTYSLTPLGIYIQTIIL